MMPRNVLLILTDQQRKDSIGAYGNPVAGTPALDRLAREGARFERAYGTNPFCCPSRASILTGLYPRTHGVWDNGVQFNAVGAPTLGDQTFFIQCSFPDPHHPFSACEPYATLYDPAALPEPIPASLDELEVMPPHYRAIHLGEERVFSRARPFPSEIAGAPLREMAAQTYGMVTHADRCIGRILDYLEARGLLDETLVIFTTDHGELPGLGRWP